MVLAKLCSSERLLREVVTAEVPVIYERETAGQSNSPRQAQDRVIEAIIISAPEMFGCRERARVDIAWVGLSQPGAV